MKNLIFASFILITLKSSAQQCNCSGTYTWMAKTFEKNDAGFQYVIDKKGEEDYKKHYNLFREKVKNITSSIECQTIINDWLKYFRPGHIAFGIKEQAAENVNSPSKSQVIATYKNEKTIDLTEKQFKDILLNNGVRQPIEGIWNSGIYKVGIIAEKADASKFSAFIIKADSVYWMPKQIKAELALNSDNTFSANYLMRDHSKINLTANFINESKSILSLSGYWVKEFPKTIISENEKLFLEFLQAEMPFLKQLSQNTLYLRIPSFQPENKVFIDSVLAANDKLISTTRNLIIDIRNGTGGGDGSYKNIIPYLYTNPLRYIGVQLYATELNAQGYEEYIKQTNDTSEINFLKNIAKKMRANLGKFINMSDQTFDIDSSYSVMPFPKKVGIICNYNNGSTDEQFLIDAKQSSKVKVFGHPTGGMLDISNMRLVNSPDDKFVLGYCMSKSYRIPNFCIDGVGIQPDYFIDDAISELNWVEYVKTVLER